MIKIAVVGTSNSILAKGYFPLYQAIEYPNQVDNYSLGASYCQYIPFALEKYVILKNYDIVLTDCCPNDGSFFPYARSADWLYNELYSIFSLIQESPCKHVHLLFPTDLPFAIHEEIHRQVCTELNIPFLDIGAILKQNKKHSEQELYADKMHISPFYAKQFAFVLKQKVHEILKNPAPSHSNQSYKSKEYFSCELAKHTDFPQMTRATSLRAENFVQLKNKQEICLENLPPCNLESLYFYTNIEAGYYHLSTEQNIKNYNLSYHLANIFHFRPLPASFFAVSKFLKIQTSISPQCQEIIEELNFPPHDNNTSELLINALLFSREVNAPLTWQAKEMPPCNERDLKNYQKINRFLSALDQYHNSALPVPEEFIVLAASIFPKHQTIRKRFVTLLKKTQNPYFYFYFASFYLMPRKKYSMAAALLEHALSIQNNILFSELLAQCYLKQKLFAKAYAFIQENIADTYPIIRLKLLITWAKMTNNKKEFSMYAQKMLDYGTSISHMALLAETSLAFGERELAKEFLNLITIDPRNFHHNEDKEIINALKEKIDNHLT